MNGVIVSDNDGYLFKRYTDEIPDWAMKLIR